MMQNFDVLYEKGFSGELALTVVRAASEHDAEKAFGTAVKAGLFGEEAFVVQVIPHKEWREALPFMLDTAQSFYLKLYKVGDNRPLADYVGRGPVDEAMLHRFAPII